MGSNELSTGVKIAIYVLASVLMLTLFIILLLVLRNHFGIPWKKSNSSHEKKHPRHLDVEYGNANGVGYGNGGISEKHPERGLPEWRPTMDMRGNRTYLMDGRGTEMPYEMSVSGYAQLFNGPPGKARLKAI